MAHSSPPFDEELLSGYLDGTLSQRDTQRVRLHLEANADSRRLVAEMRALRQSALETPFSPPDIEEWPELPKTRSSRLSRSLGWLLLISWLTIVTAIALWKFLSATGDPVEIFLVLGLPGGFFLLFLSVLIDRARDLATDRYRDVHR